MKKKLTKYTIKIDEIPPNLNKIIFVSQRHWGIYAGMKKSWKKLINDKINPNWQPFATPVIIKITFVYCDRRSRDPDNATPKMLLDGLTQKENPDKYIIFDDSMKWIKDLHIKLVSKPELETSQTIIEVSGCLE